MRKLLFILTLMLLPSLASAQTKSKVTLKNGTEITGVIIAIDPTDAIKINIGGVETTIKMSDVAKIDDAEQLNDPENPLNVKVLNDVPEKLLITDKDEYPESFELKVGDYSIKMILVRGGDLNMGYDGRGSLFMDSEPVHPVKVTTFYISQDYVTSGIESALEGKTNRKSSSIIRTWKKANEIIDKIKQKTGIPVRLPTEAEWEYASCSPQQDAIFNSEAGPEHCLDYFGKYVLGEIVVDPIGPQDGRYHVVRDYNRKKGKLDRSPIINYREHGYFRLAIKAKDVESPRKDK